MTISIQCPDGIGTCWEDFQPTLFAVKDWQEAMLIAHEISKSNNCCTVRVTQPLEGVAITRAYISRCNGTYVNATQFKITENEN